MQTDRLGGSSIGWEDCFTRRTLRRLALRRLALRRLALLRRRRDAEDPMHGKAAIAADLQGVVRLLLKLLQLPHPEASAEFREVRAVAERRPIRHVATPRPKHSAHALSRWQRV